MQMFEEKPLRCAAVRLPLYGPPPPGLETLVVTGKIKIDEQNRVCLPTLFVGWMPVEPGRWLVVRGDGSVTSEAPDYFARRWAPVDAVPPVT